MSSVIAADARPNCGCMAFTFAPIETGSPAAARRGLWGVILGKVGSTIYRRSTVFVNQSVEPIFRIGLPSVTVQIRSVVSQPRMHDSSMSKTNWVTATVCCSSVFCVPKTIFRLASVGFEVIMNTTVVLAA